ncbi:MAG: TetR/AcrR family transcriptional regulator [Microlunatus sp.]
MNEAAAGTRERILTATGTLLRRQGYAATGLQEIAGQSGARIGSIYHFFAGKEALADESIRTSGAAYGAMVLGLLRNGPTDPADALRAVFTQAAADLAAADSADACPIATVALEVASTNETLRQATADVFTAWTDGLTSWCGEAVDDPDDAHDLAIAILATLEGAFILARAQRSPEPLLAAGRSISRLADSMRAGTPTRSTRL